MRLLVVVGLCSVVDFWGGGGMGEGGSGGEVSWRLLG